MSNVPTKMAVVIPNCEVSSIFPMPWAQLAQTMLSSEPAQLAITRLLPYHERPTQWIDGTIRIGHGLLHGPASPMRLHLSVGYRAMRETIVQAERNVRSAVDVQLSQGQFDCLALMAYLHPAADIGQSDVVLSINDGQWQHGAMWISRMVSHELQRNGEAAPLLAWGLAAYTAPDVEKATLHNAMPPL